MLSQEHGSDASQPPPTFLPNELGIPIQWESEITDLSPGPIIQGPHLAFIVP